VRYQRFYITLQNIESPDIRVIRQIDYNAATDALFASNSGSVCCPDPKVLGEMKAVMGRTEDLKGHSLRPERPKIEDEAESRGSSWGRVQRALWKGREPLPTSQGVWRAPVGLGVQPRPPQRFSLFLALTVAFFETTNISLFLFFGHCLPYVASVHF